MGLLRSHASGSAWVLGARHLIGRSPTCHLRIASDYTSQEHAVLWWEDGRWWLRDLGSSNGTRVEGQALPPGGQVALAEGATLEFGDDSQRWILESARPPVAIAVPLDGGEVVESVDGLLALPQEEQPQLVLHRRADGGWALESEDADRRVANLEVLVVADRSWRVHLPERVDATLSSRSRDLRLPHVTLEFRVSRNEETVEVAVRNEHAHVVLDSRSHSLALLQLARIRLEEDEVEPAERGWVDRDELCRQLAIDRLLLNTLVHRARRQFADAGVLDVGDLVQRRAGGAELRLAVTDLEIAPLDA